MLLQQQWLFSNRGYALDLLATREDIRNLFVSLSRVAGPDSPGAHIEVESSHRRVQPIAVTLQRLSSDSECIGQFSLESPSWLTPPCIPATKRVSLVRAVWVLVRVIVKVFSVITSVARVHRSGIPA